VSTLPAVNSEQMKFLETGVNKRQPANAIQLSQPQLKYDDSNISNIFKYIYSFTRQGKTAGECSYSDVGWAGDSSASDMKVWLRQGSVLSLLLFAMVMEVIAQKLWQSLTPKLLYADDLILIRIHINSDLLNSISRLRFACLQSGDSTVIFVPNTTNDSYRSQRK